MCFCVLREPVWPTWPSLRSSFLIMAADRHSLGVGQSTMTHEDGHAKHPSVKHPAAREMTGQSQCLQPPGQSIPSWHAIGTPSEGMPSKSDGWNQHIATSGCSRQFCKNTVTAPKLERLYATSVISKGVQPCSELECRQSPGELGGQGESSLICIQH